VLQPTVDIHLSMEEHLHNVNDAYAVQQDDVGMQLRIAG